ncbi:hypothetical protein MSG28_015707 [Choristoneura fumiferana]|uniref:Uncharacterized protein n=1 Tax=Choristoneura fumiferana TaxID=7141 RepID=A0ACC0KBI4_CHOFU|nr:hypothetical protein MSG28_015707 [Choristoneura fumiferana]
MTQLRFRRDVAGSLDIVTNNVQPIHAEVKPEIKPATVKVVPPTSGAVFQKSLRKSLPATTKLDLIRSVNRILALLVLLLTATVEVYPILAQLFATIYDYMIEHIVICLANF